jgi:thiamine biosynthesis lipoprotein
LSAVRSRLVPLLALFWLAAGPWLHAERPLHRHEASRLSMACVYAIEMYGPDADALPRIAADALDEVDRIDRLMSHYKADSPLSRINREAARQPVGVDAELFEFIADAMRYNRESGGAFDITVGPLMKAWGFFRGEGRCRPTARSPPPAVTSARRTS